MTRGLPIWLTEVDISSTLDKETQVRKLSALWFPSYLVLITLGLIFIFFMYSLIFSFYHLLQAIYLEEVLREGFSHPSVNGIMLWTALHPNGCYQMCLTDNNFHNLPAGDAVDKLLKEWQTGVEVGQTDEQGAYSFYGFLGEYEATVTDGKKTAKSTFSLCRSDETKHFNIQL